MEFSKTATDINTKIENGELTTVDIELDDGKVVTCALMIVLTVDSTDYIVLLPLDENGQNNDGNVWLYQFKLASEDAEPELVNIEDDDEYAKVAEAFELYLDDAEFDELVELPEDGSEDV